MKSLKFRGNLVNEILEGRKIVTWRLFDDKDLKVGDKIELINWKTKEKFAEAEITEIREKRLGEIEGKDFEGHEKYDNKEEIFQHYKEYYGDKVTAETIVKIIEFRLLS